MNTSSMLKVVLAFAVLLSSASAALAQGKTKLLWLGQASWRIESPGGKVIVIDPWLTQGPKAPAEYKDLAKLGKVDVLLVTHAHVDHIGDAAAIAKMYKTKLYGPADARLPGRSTSRPFDGLCLAIKDLAVEPRFGGDPTHFIANAFFRIEDHQSELGIGHGPSSCDKPDRDPQT